MIDRRELGAWLRLLETPSIGRESARKLLAAFGSPQAVIEASTSARREVVPLIQAQALSVAPEGFASLLDATCAWLADAQSEARAVVTLGDPSYPSALFDSPDPPVMLYVQGRIELLHADSIAVVGSRNPTPQGSANAKEFARHLSRAGFTVVSGMASGVDAAAHEGGLESAASTIAVVGTGLDRVYPQRNLALAHRIAKQGSMVSEYSLGSAALPVNFPLRNRIIAGLARGTLVVEAALKSGSLITARLANEAGRDVFAIPGSIHSPQSRGCHALIKQGAKLVETAQDILEELAPHDSTPVSAPPIEFDVSDVRATSEDQLYVALGFDPVTLDALVARTGWPASKLSFRLLELELEGQVARLPGQLFQRTTQV